MTTSNCENEEHLAKITESSAYIHLTGDCTWRVEVNPGMLSSVIKFHSKFTHLFTYYVLMIRIFTKCGDRNCPSIDLLINGYIDPS